MIQNFYYVDSYGPDGEAAQKAFHWLLQQPSNIVYIAVMSKGMFKESEVYKDAMGETLVKELHKNNRVDFLDKEIHLVYKPYIKYQRKDPILVFYPNKKFLDEIDSHHPSSILIVPWLEHELDYWIESNNAIKI